MQIVSHEGGVVYLLTAPSGKRYVGQTWDLPRRMNRYRCGESTAQPALHHAITKHGWENFRVVVLACGIQTQDALDATEDAFIIMLGTMSPGGYNLKRGGARGKLCAESRQKIGDAQRGEKNHMFGKKQSAESNAKRKATMSSPEVRAKLSAARRGKRHSAEHIAKMSAANSGEGNPFYGRKHSAETKRKIAGKLRGRKNGPPSPETREKIAASKRGVPKSPEHRAKIAATLRGRKLSPEHVAKAAAANRGRKRSPEARARMSAAAKAYYARKREGNS